MTTRIRELLVDLYGCKGDLNSAGFLVECLKTAAQQMGSKIVEMLSHQYSPAGVSVIIILAETHISIHTWPEHGYAALDIFVCKDEVDPEVGWRVVKEALQPSSFEVHRLNRRIGP